MRPGTGFDRGALVAAFSSLPIFRVLLRVDCQRALSLPRLDGLPPMEAGFSNDAAPRRQH
jgi:hypothetical protein